jgi:hypothetical protein
VVSPAEPQPTVVEERRAPVVKGAQQATAAAVARPEAEVQLAAPAVVALPAASAVEGHPAPAAAETRPEAAAAALQQEPVAAEARSEATVGAQQEAALAGSSRAMVVEIPDDDAPPPGWDQWVNLPMPSPESQEGVLVRRWDDHMVAGGRGHCAEASSSHAGRSASREGRVDEPPAFADAQEEQREHGTALNRALNEALQIRGGPAWRVFQVRSCCLFSSISSFSCLFLAARCLLAWVCWGQELEHRARCKYGAFDQMSAEPRRLQEQRDAFVALAEALGTQDGWLSYRVEALRDQLLEHEGQSTAPPPPPPPPAVCRHAAS